MEGFDLSVLAPESEAQVNPETVQEWLPAKEYEPPSRPTTVAHDLTNAAKAALIGSKSPEEMRDLYQKVNAETTNKLGFSESIAAVKNQEKAMSIDTAKRAYISSLTGGDHDGSANGISAITKGFGEAVDEINSQNLDQMLAQKLNRSFEHGRRDEGIVGVNAINAEIRAKQNVQAMANSVLAGTSGNALPFIAGITQSVMPLVESESTRRILEDLQTSLGDDSSAAVKSYLLTGEAKDEIRSKLDALAITNPEEYERIAGDSLALLRDNTNIIYQNDFATYMRLQELFGFDGAEYTTFDKVLDDVGGVADVVGLGGIAREAKLGAKALKSSKLFETLADTKAAKIAARMAAQRRAASNAVKKNTISSVQEASPISIANDYNPEETKKLVDIALAGDEEATIAIAGTKNAEDVAVQFYGPQIPSETGVLNNQVRLSPDDPLRELVDEGGSLNLTPEEVASQLNARSASIRNTPGVNIHESMIPVETAQGIIELPGGVRVAASGDEVAVHAVIGFEGRPFTSAQEAIDHTTHILAKDGVLASDIEVIKRVGNKYTVVNKEDILDIERSIPDRAGVVQGDYRAKWAAGVDGFKPKAADLTEGGKRAVAAVGPDGKRITGGKTPKTFVRDSKGKFVKRTPASEVYDQVDELAIAKVADDSAMWMTPRDIRNLANVEPTVSPVVKVGTKADRISQMEQGALRLAKQRGTKYVPEVDPTLKELRVRKAAREVSKGNVSPLKQMADKEQEIKTQKALQDAADRPAEYLVRVRQKSVLVPTDNVALAAPEIPHNWIDRAFAGYNGPSLSDLGWGSLQQYLLDAATTFKSSFVFGAASNAIDRISSIEHVLLTPAKRFSEKLRHLNKEQATKVKEFIEKANNEGIRFDPTWARVNAWSEDAIQTLHEWRGIWDRIYVLENADLIKTERAAGRQILIIPGTTDTALVKNIHKSQINKHMDGDSLSVWNPANGAFEALSRSEIKALQDEGGAIALTKRPIEINGAPVTYIKVSNKPGHPYTRDISNGDQLLSYREGYYSRRYKDNHFIRKSIKDSKGNHLYWKAVGSADTLKNANILHEKFITKDSSAEVGDYVVTADMKGSDAYADAMYDLQKASGRSAQRMRGEALVTDFTDDAFEMATTTDPMEAIVTSIRSISRRTALRSWFDTSKARLLKNYDDLLERNPETGMIMYPSKASDIRHRGIGEIDYKRIADARSLFNYVRSLEDGYVNLLDDGWKGALNFLANTVAPYTALGEKVVRSVADMRGPIQAARTGTAILTLFSHPLRQFIVQSSQALQLLSVANPKWIAGSSGQQIGLVYARMGGLDVSDTLLKAAGISRRDFDNVYANLERSGMLLAIDRQNLVRGVLGDMAERASYGKVKKALTAPLHYARKGLDWGETLNMVAHHMAFSDLAIRAGKDLADPRVAADISAQIRAFTGSMNEAGDMPYNHGLISVPFQFAQIGHKMFSNMLLNQNMTKWQRIKLIGTNLLVFGYPMQALYEQHISQHLPEDPVLRNVVREGLLNWGFNESIKMVTDSNTRIDFSGSMSPFNSSLATTIASIVSTDFLTTIGKSPAGSLIFGNNPKIDTMFRELSQWVIPDEKMPPATFVTVSKSAAVLFSGMSAGFKAKYIFEHGRTLNTKGVTSDYHADWVAATAAVFGFRTQDEVALTALNNMEYEGTKAWKDDIKETYNIFARRMALQGVDSTDPEYIRQSVAMGFSTYGGTPEFYKEWNKYVMGGAKKGEFQPLVDIYNQATQITLGDAIERLKMLPDSDKPENLQRVIDSMTLLKQQQEAAEDGYIR